MPRKKSKDQKDKIAKSATDIFIEKGYRGTSLQDIAQAVGITKAGIYHYFKTKEEILYYILSSHDEKNVKTFTSIRAEIEQPGVDSTTALKKIVRGYARLSATKQNINLLGLRERGQLTGINHENYYKINQRIFSDLKNDISKLDNLKKSLDSAVIVFMIISMSNWFGYWLKEDGKLSLDEAIEQMIDIICHGVLD